MNVSFGGLVAKAREKKELTLRKLSPLVGLAPSFLSELEQGRRLPPKQHEKIQLLSEVLDIPLEQLKQAAVRERAKKKSPNFFSKLISTNEDLAWGLCRAADNADSDELEKAFKKALEMLEKPEASNNEGDPLT